MLDNPKNFLYLNLAKIILADIQNNKLKTDHKILPERTYCEKYKVSRATVRQAMSYLEQKGYIYKVQGSGTFISSGIIKQKLLTFYSFTEEMKKQGKNPSSKIISFKSVAAGEFIANQLEIDENDPVYELVRLRIADDEPMMYSKTYLISNQLPDLKKQELFSKPLYDVLQKKYNIKLNKAIEKFSTLLPTNKIAKILKVSEKFPVIKLERKTYSSDFLLEYTVAHLRGDKFEFEVELK